MHAGLEYVECWTTEVSNQGLTIFVIKIRYKNNTCWPMVVFNRLQFKFLQSIEQCVKTCETRFKSWGIDGINASGFMEKVSGMNKITKTKFGCNIVLILGIYMSPKLWKFKSLNSVYAILLLFSLSTLGIELTLTSDLKMDTNLWIESIEIDRHERQLCLDKNN